MSKACDYDNSIKVGELVTGYGSGYWRVDEIINRPGTNPLFRCQRLLNAKGQPDSNGAGQWDASHSRRVDMLFVTKQFNDQLQQAISLRETLLELVSS